jgi:hypothetical protein
MSADVSIYEVIKDEYENTHFNKFPQSIKLDEATPKILIKNISQNKIDDKDKAGRYSAIYRVEVIGTVYLTCKDTAAAITQILESHTDTNIYLVSFDGEYYDVNDELGIHRVITDYKTFINL